MYAHPWIPLALLSLGGLVIAFLAGVFQHRHTHAH
jgi:hypothetical protein